MNTPRHDAANSRNQIYGGSYANDTSRSADDVDHIFAAAAGADRVPMRIESANRNRNAGRQPEMFRPARREFSRSGIGPSINTIQLGANTGKKRVNFHQELFRGQSAERSVPHPLVAHGANTAFDGARVSKTAESRGDHVAVLKGRCEGTAFRRVVAQPVQQF